MCTVERFPASVQRRSSVAKLWRGRLGCGEAGKNLIHHRDTRGTGKTVFGKQATQHLPQLIFKFQSKLLVFSVSLRLCGESRFDFPRHSPSLPGAVVKFRTGCGFPQTRTVDIRKLRALNNCGRFSAQMLNSLPSVRVRVCSTPAGQRYPAKRAEEALPRSYDE